MPRSLIEALNAELDSLAIASRKLGSLATQQSAREREIQSLCASVWMVANQKYTVQGRCGDQQQYVVTHTYTQQVATIHAEKFDALRSEMCAHLEFATGTLASALFGHARAEHQLFGFLQSRVLALELEPPLLLDLLRAVASRLDGNDGGAGGETLDARSLPVLRKLALTLGSQLRAGALTTGGGGVTELHATLLSLLFRGRGCAWAAPLLQPPASELGTNRWLWHLLVNAPAESGSLAAAADLEAFVAQLDWSELATLPPKDVDAYVIQPIQRALRRYDESEQPAAVTLLASLLAAAARAQPSLTQPALTVLTRSTVRAALTAAPTLALWPWASLAPEVLWACWCELYRVPATRIDDYEVHRPPSRPPAFPPARLSARPPVRPRRRLTRLLRRLRRRRATLCSAMRSKRSLCASSSPTRPRPPSATAVTRRSPLSTTSSRSRCSPSSAASRCTLRTLRAATATAA